MENLVRDIKLTIKDLLSRKGRSFLTILGIIIGVAGVIIIISLGAGAQSLVVGQITKLGTNLVGVLPGKGNEKGPPAAVFGVQIKTLSLYDLDSIKDKSNVPNATAIAPFVRSNATVIAGKESVDTTFSATSGEYPYVQRVDMEKGYFFSEDEAKAGANVIILGYDVAQALFPNGNELGQIVKIKVNDAGGVPFRVIGVQAKMGTVAFQNQDDQVFIPFSVGQRQLLGIDYVQFIRIKVDKEENMSKAMEDIARVLRDNHRIKDPNNDDFDIRNLSDALKMITSITDVLRTFLGLMAGISLIVGGIGIMNIMLVTVSERTREIGLRKAIGATTRKIRDQFLLEAVVITSIGGIIGILVGIFISYIIALGVRFAGYDWAFVISPFAVILAVSVSVLTGIIFGLHPARKASKLDPIEALRYE
ncbi:MAG: FtsX-like permease family protein [Candidatus Moranbacteria bacterium]|nr:FtsX-like permease family protein [Candidatus Moranbacteria bacterium]